jgi:hypothetical protein
MQSSLFSQLHVSNTQFWGQSVRVSGTPVPQSPSLPIHPSHQHLLSPVQGQELCCEGCHSNTPVGDLQG